MKSIQFNNISIGINAETPKEAYSKLCSLFAKNNIEYTTDTYSEENGVEKSTEELFPKSDYSPDSYDCTNTTKTNEVNSSDNIENGTKFSFLDIKTWRSSCELVPLHSKEMVLFNKLSNSFKKNKRLFKFIQTAFASSEALEAVTVSDIRSKAAYGYNSFQKDMFAISIYSPFSNKNLTDKIASVFNFIEKGYNPNKFDFFYIAATEVINWYNKNKRYIKNNTVCHIVNGNASFDMHMESIEEINKLKAQVKHLNAILKIYDDAPIEDEDEDEDEDDDDYIIDNT